MGRTKTPNGGKLPQVLKDEAAEKLPEILKDRTVETTPNLKKKFKVFLILAFFHNKWGVIVTFPDILD